MAKVEAKDIPEIARFMDDFWKMIKDYWEPEEDDEYWTALMDDIHKLVAKYPYTFCSKMCVAYLDYLDLIATGKLNESA